MADFYADMANMARDLLAPTSQGGLGQGVIRLLKQVAPTPPVNDWDPPAASTWTATPLKGAVRGVGQDLVGAPVPNGGQIVSSDKQAIVAPWGGTADVVDVLEIDGEEFTILAVSRIPEAGTTSAIRLIIRG